MPLLPWLVLLSVMALACDSVAPRSRRKEDVDNGYPGGWGCGVDSITDGCHCSKLKPGWDDTLDDEAQCLAYDCCLLNESETMFSTASCECFDGATDCQAEASTRRNTRVVSQCPPSDDAPASSKECAPVGENCRKDYLQQHDLSGCCAGSICAANAARIPVCREATTEEITLVQKCEKVARTSELDALRVTDGSLMTNQGVLQFDTWRFPFIKVGAGGCLKGLSTELAVSSGTCSLRLQVEVQGERLSVVSITGLLNGCPGFTGSLLDSLVNLSGPAAQAAAEFSFEGLACSNDVVFEAYCVSGRFDFNFHAGMGTTLADDHVIAEGVICSGGMPEGDCPQP